MKIADVISFLETVAHPSLQEDYDNTGLITGQADWNCSGIICSLDATEEVISEAIENNCNLIVAHHPIIFGGLKKINGKNYVERTVINAIKNDIAIYAIHTNLDNIREGVSGRMASILGLENVTVLSEKENTLKKLITFVPVDKADRLRNAVFAAGAGHIGNYSECSFNMEGTGTFNAGKGTDPYVGEVGKRHQENEIKIEVILPSFMENKIVKAMREAHPYEEPAYDIIPLSNSVGSIGAGVIGDLPGSQNGNQFLKTLKQVFNTTIIRHTAILDKPIKKIALCGGAGSFLIFKALSAGADAFITADIKYHQFFDADKRMLICDIGHYESEQFTINLLHEILGEKFPTFAILKTRVNTNPVQYY